MDFKQELQNRGAREFQIVALSMDEERGLAAIAEAERRGVEHVMSYAITLFDDPSWSPTGAKSRPVQLTNRAVEVNCPTCGGNRLVLVREYDPMVMYDEEYRPCPSCNANADTKFFRRAKR